MRMKTIRSRFGDDVTVYEGTPDEIANFTKGKRQWLTDSELWAMAHRGHRDHRPIDYRKETDQ